MQKNKALFKMPLFSLFIFILFIIRLFTYLLFIYLFRVPLFMFLLFTITLFIRLIIYYYIDIFIIITIIECHVAGRRFPHTGNAHLARGRGAKLHDLSPHILDMLTLFLT